MVRTVLSSALSLVALGGCAQLFGIDETSGGVRLTFQRVSIGATVVTAPLDLTGLQASYLVPDDVDPSGLVRIPAIQAGDTWLAAIDDATPPIEFDLPDFPMPVRRQFDFPNPTLAGSFGVFEHPNPTPGDPAATLTVNVVLDTPFVNEAFQLLTLGSWNNIGIPAPAPGAAAIATAPFTLPATNLFGRPLEKITSDDAVVVLRYVGNQLTGSMTATPFDQTGADAINGTMVANPLDQTLDIRVGVAEALRRYGEVRPPTVGNAAFSWALRASPGHSVAEDFGPLLHAAGVAQLDPPTVTAMFGNPFKDRGWETVLTWSTGANRTFVPAGQSLPVTLNAAMFQRALPSPGLELTLPAGLPDEITLGGERLTSDGLTISAPARAVEVTFEAVPADNTLFGVQLLELVPNVAMTALELRIVYATNGVAPRFVLPPEILVPGRSYTLRAVSVLGSFPNIADGDLQTRELPVAVSFLDSGVFQVAP